MAYLYEKRRKRQTRQKAILLTLLVQSLLIIGLFFHGEALEWMQSLFQEWQSTGTEVDRPIP